MIQIYYAYPDIIKESNLDDLTSQLSLRYKSRLAGFKRDEDKLLLLTSSVLLSKILLDNGYNDYEICDLQYSKTGRPFFLDSPFDFNISHTENCAIVAFSESGRVGIDIEKIKDVDFLDFESIFSDKVWNKIYLSDNKNKMFYYYWTLLESALKADGRGLSLISSKKVAIKNDQVIIGGKEWFSHHQNFDSTISCCVTSNKEDEAILLHEIQFI